jgi:hypothetical protein
MQRLHAQDDRGQRGAQDFRLGELGALQEILLVVQADAHAAATRPQRPARWLAADCAIGSICSCSTLLR